MEILVTGASGVLGRRVVSAAQDGGHTVRALTRTMREGPGWVQADLATGVGLDEALDGVDAVIHSATDPRRHADVDVTGTRRLVEAADRSGRPLIVYPGIVGSDVVPLRYYRSKIAAEELLVGSGLPVVVQRYTQFHQLLWTRFERRCRRKLVIAPARTRFQLLDPAAAARRMVEAASSGTTGRLPDLGGPTIYEAEDLARSVAAALGLDRRVIALNRPGLVGAALRAGANLTANRADDGETWNQFVARQIARG